MAVTSWNGRTGLVVPAAGDYDASQVKFTQNGSTFLRNVQDKLEEFVSVADFDVKNNGTDPGSQNSLKIKSAIDSLSKGGTLYFPPGVYLIQDTINIGAGNNEIHIVCAGNGNSAAGTYFRFSKTSGPLFRVEKCDGFSLSEVMIRHEPATGAAAGNLIEFAEASNVVMENVRIANSYTAVDIFRSRVLSFNRFYTAGGTGPETIRIAGGLDDSGNPDVCTNMYFNDCTIGNSGSLATGILMLEYSGTLTLNKVNFGTSGKGLWLKKTSSSLPATATPKDVRIDYFGSDNMGGSNIYLEDAEDITISNSPFGGTNAGPGIYIGERVLHFQMVNSFVRAAKEEGLYIAGKSVHIANCQIGNSSKNNLNGFSNVRIASQADDVSIIGGLCGALANGGNLASYGVQIDSGAVNTRIIGVDVTGNNAGGVNDLSPPSANKTIVGNPGTTKDTLGYLERLTSTSNQLVLQNVSADANKDFLVRSKGTGLVDIGNGNGSCLRVGAGSSNLVNFIQVSGATSAGAPSLRGGGADADVDISLVPKGSGYVRMGSYTLASDTISGYIEIKDLSGTIRKLAVIA